MANKNPFQRDEDGDLTIEGQIALLRDIRDHSRLGSAQRDDLSYLIGNLCFKLKEEGVAFSCIVHPDFGKVKEE